MTLIERVLKTGFIPMVCPQCGAQVQLDDSREFGFCSYCGTKIVQDKVVVEHRGSVSIDHSAEINNFLRRANEFYQRHDTDNAELYYNKVLDLDFDNEAARNGLQQIYKIINEPNLSISVKTKPYNSKVCVDIFVDGAKYGAVRNGTTENYKLTKGVHNVRFLIPNVAVKKDIVVDIQDAFTRLNYTVMCKFGNKIEIMQ